MTDKAKPSEQPGCRWTPPELPPGLLRRALLLPCRELDAAATFFLVQVE